jgi:putative two-component system response regulator
VNAYNAPNRNSAFNASTGDQKCEYCDAHLLIVDDDATNVMLLEDILEEAGYTQVRSTTNPFEVESLCHDFKPDLILLDLMMPGLDGFGVLEQLAAGDFARQSIPVIVLTADVNPLSKRRALTKGANDFLTKPFDFAEVLLRIHNLLITRRAHQMLQSQNAVLEERVRERTCDLQKTNKALQEAQIEILERLAHAAEYRDDDTGQHTQRVGLMSAWIGRQLDLDEPNIELLQRAAPLHDVGKIAIPDSILLKPGKLTPEEFASMQEHSNIGGNLLAGGHSPLVQMAERIARSHHERWDGSGYPNSLAGEAIPVEGRIVAVADVFDALTHERPYKKAWPVEDAVAEIVRQQNRQFDPQVVAAFLHIYPTVLASRETLQLPDVTSADEPEQTHIEVEHAQAKIQGE